MLVVKLRYNEGVWVGDSFVKIAGIGVGKQAGGEFVKIGIESRLPVLRNELLKTEEEKKFFFGKVDKALADGWKRGVSFNKQISSQKSENV